MENHRHYKIAPEPLSDSARVQIAERCVCKEALIAKGEANEQTRYCLTANGDSLHCTRISGHKGNHVACGDITHRLAEWAQGRTSPYDTAIDSILMLTHCGLHERYALTTLRGKRQGWMDCEDRLQPIVKGLLELLNHDGDWCTPLESRISDAGIALIKQAEEITKLGHAKC
ncbi:hypothetical protein LCGC14_1214280 [marine sediment metagenome]|uniref:Uncharacterized protein n=1 Tax=marine sediment metagenome TaxID=412755 RepID=A0A0F9M0K8_9ZZZZ